MGALVMFVGVPGDWRRRAVGVAVMLCALVGITGVQPVAAVPGATAPAAPAPLAPAAGPTEELTAPDGFAAGANARLTGQRVEDLSQRTETTSVYALPDGTWQAAFATGPVWVRKGGDGSRAEDWEAADATLASAPGGRFAPRAHIGDVLVSGGEQAGPDGVSVVAAVTDPETGVTSELTWPGDLPLPEVAGPRATYREVSPGIDMVVEVTGSGVEQFFVVRKRPARGAGLDLPVGLTSKGANARATGKGAVEMLTAEGELAASVSVPQMWDATHDAALGAPITTEWDVTAQPALWANGPTAPGGTGQPSDDLAPGGQGRVSAVPTQVAVDGESADLVMDPEAFLQDPAVTYPVVIDPAVNLGITFDTFVQSDHTWDNSTATDLRIGTYNGGTSVARSFLTVDLAAIQGKQVLSAELRMWQYHSFSCSAREWQVWSAAPASTATRWGAQPRWSTKWATSTDTRGYSSSCADGWSVVPITSLAQVWADSTVTPQGIALRAASETDSYGWKRFNSGNASSGKPTIVVNYNSYPNTPTGSSYGEGEWAWYPSSSAVDRQLYVRTTRPTMSAVIGDADGGNVRVLIDVLDGATPVWTGYSGTRVASGSRSYMIPTSSSIPPLQDGKTYTARSWGSDYSLTSKGFQSMGEFTVDVTPPTKPMIASSAYTDGTWYDSPPTANTFTFTTTSSDARYITYSLDDAKSWKALEVTGSPATATLEYAPTSGAHRLRVRAYDRAGWPSEEAEFTFGVGTGATITAPSTDTKTTDRLRVEASAPPMTGGSLTARVYWRFAGAEDVSGYEQDGSTSGWTEGAVLGSGTTANTINKVWAVAAEPAFASRRTPALIDVQVCFTYSAPARTWCTWTQDGSTHRTVAWVPHAFGGGYPVADAGVGQVALWTGEFNTSVTDVSVPGYVGDLSISRTYSSFAGPAETNAFGPGWRASFDGVDIGVAGWRVIDNTRVDGTISLIDDQGEALIYRQPSQKKIPLEPGVYHPADEETAEAEARLTLSSDRSTLTFLEVDGTTTVFTDPDFVTGAPLRSTPSRFVPSAVHEPNSASATSFGHEKGRITRIVAPTAPGVPSCGTTSPLPAGCRALHITYAATTTGGDVAGQVSKVEYEAWNPTTSTVQRTEVARYSYDTQGRLASVTDTRVTPALATTYEYSGSTPSGHPALVRVTPPGQAPFVLTYKSNDPTVEPTSTPTGALLATSRHEGLTTGTPLIRLASYVYGLTPETVIPGLDLGAEQVVKWGQGAAPTYGAAVFGMDRTPASHDPAAITAEDWEYASLQYTDGEGRVVNTAVRGEQGWSLTSTGYDHDGRVVRSLDSRAIDQILQLTAANGGQLLGAPVIDSYATLTRYNPKITADADITYQVGDITHTVPAGTVLTPAGTYATDVWAPATQTPNGLVRLRTHTSIDSYDLAPGGPKPVVPNNGINPKTGMPFGLTTVVTVTEADALSGTTDSGTVVPLESTVLDRTVTGYAPIDGVGLLDATSGWVLGSPTTTTVGSGTTAVITRTRYDAEGRVVETRQPESAGNDAGTTLTAYYTKAAQTGATAACGGKPQWAGLTCRIARAETTATVPVQVVSEYSMYLAPKTTTETLGATSTSPKRTTRTEFDGAGRPVSSTVEVANVAGSTARPTTKTVYDSATGQAVATVSLNGTTEVGRISTGYDTWGRQTTYTDTDGQVTTTTYDAAGRVASVSDPKGAVSYQYNGGNERRGLLTSQTISGGGTFTATYGIDGSITQQTFTQPLTGGGSAQRMTQTSTRDRAGQETGLSYQITTATGTAQVGWTRTYDAQSKVASDTGQDPSGATRTQVFGYDHADRLTTVTDTIGGVCTTRAYAFDRNGNRTALTTTNHTGQCDTTGTSTTKTWNYDKADRIQTGANTTGAYVHDDLGRQTTVPGIDTPAGAAAGDLQIAYYHDDLARSLTQNGVTTVFELDPAARRATSTTTGAPAGTTTTVRHYTDASDNPGWATTTTGAITKTTRYTGSIAGDLGMTITDGAAQLTLADLHGNIATTIDLPATGPVIGAMGRYDEYGNTLSASKPTTGALTYGWLGAKERATDTTGLLLMGARMYNPITGLFTSVDPVVGGNTTAYTYPQDPINMRDLDGRIKINWKKVIQVASFVAIGVCVVASAGACAVAAGVAFAASAAVRTSKFVRSKEYRTKEGWARYGSGLALDAVSARLPGVRYVQASRLARHVATARHKFRPVYHSVRSSLRTRKGWRNAAGQGGAAVWVGWGW